MDRVAAIVQAIIAGQDTAEFNGEQIDVRRGRTFAQEAEWASHTGPNRADPTDVCLLCETIEPRGHCFAAAAREWAEEYAPAQRKPGRKATGRTRALPVQVMLTADEDRRFRAVLGPTDVISDFVRAAIMDAVSGRELAEIERQRAAADPTHPLHKHALELEQQP